MKFRSQLTIFFLSLLHIVLHKLARSISHALHTHTRQQVIATSLVYFKRFFVKNGLESMDPLLVCATCFYLASMVVLVDSRRLIIGLNLS